MQFPKTFRIWNAAAKKRGRYSMHNAQLSNIRPVSDGVDGPPRFTGDLVATNGTILAVIPVEIESKGGDGPDAKDPLDTEGLVDCDALKRAAKIGGTRKPYLVLPCNGGHGTIDGVTSPRPTEGEFPRYKAVVPNPKTWTRPTRIALNANLLADLASAIGSDGCVVLEFESEPKDPRYPAPILVSQHGKRDGAYGVIMPITIERD